jgi:polyisoprenyl-teichoic acid--peptidoglycan teichoic acid transferase
MSDLSGSDPSGGVGTLPDERPDEQQQRARTEPDSARFVRASLQAQRRSEQVKLRRGLTFLAMTLLLPGSAQMVAGNRRLGRLALRIWAALWAMVALAALLALVWRGAVVSTFTFAPVLRMVQGVMVALGISWGLLFIDSWRLSRPPELARRHRLGFAVVTAALVFAVVASLFAAASMVGAQRDLVRRVFAGGGDQKAKAGRYNILLMGGDAGKTRVGLRPDSVTVASVDAETGRTVLISLPRNLEDAPFPPTSPLHQRFPEGYGCPDNSCMLNAIYTYATENKDLYPGVANPGAQATKEAVEGITGLTINYWVLIDLKGFEGLVDAVGGITLDVHRPVPIGGGSTKVSGYVQPGKGRHLNGYEALWFARSRADSSDYDRMVRQKCVMNAMLKQLDPVTVLTNFNRIAQAGKEVVATDIPSSQVNELMELALLARDQPVASLALVPPLVHPGNPDFAKIRASVQTKIDGAEDADRPDRASGSASATQGAPSATQAAPSGKATTSAKDTKKSLEAAQQTDDLGAACSA